MPVTNYIWDVVSDNVLMEKDDDDETIARYVQEPSLYGEAISQSGAARPVTTTTTAKETPQN